MPHTLHLEIAEQLYRIDIQTRIVVLGSVTVAVSRGSRCVSHFSLVACTNCHR